jgi:2,5-dihydroxypyridine 5,6-dioxygenase
VTATLHRLFFDQLKLCAVSSGQLVGVIAEAGHKGAYVEAAVAAAKALGADAVVLTASSLSNPVLPDARVTVGKDVPALLLAAGACDIVLDLTVGGLIHSDVRVQITGKGRRMLFVARTGSRTARPLPISTSPCAAVRSVSTTRWSSETAG